MTYTLDEPPILYELISKLEGKAKLPFPLILKKVHSTKKELVIESDLSKVKHLWLDYQPAALSLCSAGVSVFSSTPASFYPADTSVLLVAGTSLQTCTSICTSPDVPVEG